MKKKFYNKRNILLSIVAFILITIMTVGMTYGWIDDLTDVTISSSNSGTDTPLTVGKNIHETFVLGSSESTVIDLGRTTRTENDKEVISDEGYFYESGGMHLSPIVGDGNNFYVKKNGRNITGYRKLTHDDHDVSLISFTLKITSPERKAEFWFSDIPSFVFKKDNAEDDGHFDAIRVSITADGMTNVYSNLDTGDDEYCYKTLENDDDTGTTTMNDARYFKNYTYNDSSNVSSSRGKNGNTLFSVNGGETKVVNIKLWLEDDIISNLERQTFNDINFKLVSSYTKTRTITISNKTAGTSSNTWMFNDNAHIYVAIPAARTGSSWTAYDGNNTMTASYWDITSNLQSNGSATITVPSYYNDEELLVFRCSAGWNSSTQPSGTSAPVARSDYNIKCWNFWETNIPDTFKNETYTMYGASYDGTVSWAYNDTNNNRFYNVENKGYGTWSEVIKIYFHSNPPTNTVGNNYAYYDGNQTNVFIEDYSDYTQNGHVYYYTMTPTSTNTSGSGNTIWEGYIPVTSKKIEFRFNKNRDTSSSNSNNSYWGFANQTNATTFQSSYNYTSGYERGSSNTFKVTYRASGNNKQWGKGTWSSVAETTEATTAATTAATQATTAPITDSMTGYTVGTQYKLVKENNETYYFLGKSGVNDMKAKVYLTAGSTTYFNVKDNSHTYGLNEKTAYQVPCYNEINISYSQTAQFGFTATQSANYIVTLTMGSNDVAVINSIKLASS